MAGFGHLDSGPITGSEIAASLPAMDKHGNPSTVAAIGHGPQVYNLMHAMGLGNRVTVDEAMLVRQAWKDGVRASRSSKDTAASAEFKARAAEQDAQ